MRDLYQIFLCMLPMSVARSCSGKLTIGRIAYHPGRDDGSAQRGRSISLIYDCLVNTNGCNFQEIFGAKVIIMSNTMLAKRAGHIASVVRDYCIGQC